MPKFPGSSRREDQNIETLAQALRLAYPPQDDTGPFEALLDRIAEDDTDARPAGDV